MKFTWLHISDLHADMSDEEYLLPSVRKDFCNSSWGHCRSIAERARRPDGGSSVLRQ